MMDGWLTERVRTASDPPLNTQIQRSRVSDLPFHAGFEVTYLLPPSPPSSSPLHLPGCEFLSFSVSFLHGGLLIEGCGSNRPDVQSQHPGAGPMMVGGGGPPPPPQGIPPGHGGPPQGQGGMMYK